MLQRLQGQEAVLIEAASARARTQAGGGEAVGRSVPALTTRQRLARRSEVAVVVWGLLNQLYSYAHTKRELDGSQHLGQLCLAATRLGVLLISHQLPLATWWRARCGCGR